MVAPAWLEVLCARLAAGRTQALVTVVAVRGSAPREAGTRMVIDDREVHGTIGGGHLEFQAIRIARDLLAGGVPEQRQRFSLGAALGQCCGGAVELAFERVAVDAAWPAGLMEAMRDQPDAGADRLILATVLPPAGSGRRWLAGRAKGGKLGGVLGWSEADTEVDRLLEAQAHAPAPRPAVCRCRLAGPPLPAAIDLLVEEFGPVGPEVLVFGAGHVARALVEVLALAGFPEDYPLRWVDPRAGQFPPHLPPGVVAVTSDDPVGEAIDAAPGTVFAVLTHSHALDEALAEAILRRNDFAYFAMIGSSTKRRSFTRRLLARGIAPQALARMVCPIGIDGIAGKAPGRIALAFAAQLAQQLERLAGAQGQGQRSAGGDSI